MRQINLEVERCFILINFSFILIIETASPFQVTLIQY